MARHARLKAHGLLPNPSSLSVDFERRFGGLRRLYGSTGAQAIFDSHVVVVGVGGVGSWAAEALARSGVGRITLIDLDHVSESNINRQVHALGTTVGQAKVIAMRQRLLDINPRCQIEVVEDFLTPDNLVELLGGTSAGWSVPAVLDACDQMKTKVALAAWSLAHGSLLVSVGAAGGKSQAQAVEVGCLSDVTHDPLLAQVRYRLRKHHGVAKAGGRIPLTCVFSREAVSPPQVACAPVPGNDGSLNCHGYGSVVTVTAAFGLVAAGHLLCSLSQQKNTQSLIASEK